MTEPLDPPIAKVTVVLEKFSKPGDPSKNESFHTATMLLRASHLDKIQRIHGMSLITWLETAIEVELDRLDAQQETTR